MPLLIISHSQVKSQAWSAPRPVSPSPPLPLTFTERVPQPPRRRLVSIRVIVIVENLLVVDPFRTGIIIRAVVDLLIVRVGM